jgi:hypothetical protein
MPKATKTYTVTDVERFHELGDITENGVTYDSWMVGSSGMRFCLLQQRHHSATDIAMAKRYLKRDRDVIQITVAEVDKQPENTDSASVRSPRNTRFSY